MVGDSRIHRQGLFLREDYQLVVGDLLLYPGKVYFTTTEDGFDVQVDLYPNAKDERKKDSFHKVIESFKNKDKDKNKVQEQKGNISFYDLLLSCNCCCGNVWYNI